MARIGKHISTIETGEPRIPKSKWRRPLIGISGVFLATLLMITFSGSMEAMGEAIVEMFYTTEKDTPPPPRVLSTAIVSPDEASLYRRYTVDQLTIHPRNLYAEWFGTNSDKGSNYREPWAGDFQKLLGLYETRQEKDDNFTMRVLDERSGEILEVLKLPDVFRAYRRTNQITWKQLDKKRRTETKRLVSKYTCLGIPPEAITVKWGRANQVREARERDAPIIEYELRLANALGLSLLSTEIGTVETFNDDRLVSRVGARGRFQMMPYMLREYGIHHYRLKTVSGAKIQVREEWHPLLTLEPAFLLVRGYTNAVGHELPGLSAYHTGPANLFKVFQLFLTESNDAISSSTNVVDAFTWALTSGYETVSKKTSFRGYSRGYVPSAHGALVATHQVPVDTMLTLRAERVQLQKGKSIRLGALLNAMRQFAPYVSWFEDRPGESLYNRFRGLNPHIDLPDAPDSINVPREGNVTLISQVRGSDVRLFLPLGSTRLLTGTDADVFDKSKTTAFDRHTFAAPEHWEVTDADIRYESLIADIYHFGFTAKNRVLLTGLVTEFEQLAAENPSPYRLRQLRVIHTHDYVWTFNQWRKLKATTAAASGKLNTELRPLAPLSTH